MINISLNAIIILFTTFFVASCSKSKTDFHDSASGALNGLAEIRFNQGELEETRALKCTNMVQS